MTEPQVFDSAEEEALTAAVAALERGELVVFPTDTVYGIAARPDMPAATEAVFEAKERPRGLTLPVLVADAGDLTGIATAEPRAASLATRFWPGALTLVLPREELSIGWDLGAARDTIAIRVPDHPVALDLLRRTGPLATTSANRSGSPTPPDCVGVLSELGGSVAVYLCAEPVPAGTASTIVDLTGTEPRIAREGAIPASDVLGAL